MTGLIWTLTLVWSTTATTLPLYFNSLEACQKAGASIQHQITPGKSWPDTICVEADRGEAMFPTSALDAQTVHHPKTGDE